MLKLLAIIITYIAAGLIYSLYRSHLVKTYVKNVDHDKILKHLNSETHRRLGIIFKPSNNLRLWIEGWFI